MAAVEAQMDRMKEAGGETQSLITMQRSRGANGRLSGSHGGPSPSSFVSAAAALRYSDDTSSGLVPSSPPATLLKLTLVIFSSLQAIGC